MRSSWSKAEARSSATCWFQMMTKWMSQLTVLELSLDAFWGYFAAASNVNPHLFTRAVAVIYCSDILIFSRLYRVLKMVGYSKNSNNKEFIAGLSVFSFRAIHTTLFSLKATACTVDQLRSVMDLSPNSKTLIRDIYPLIKTHWKSYTSDPNACFFNDVHGYKNEKPRLYQRKFIRSRNDLIFINPRNNNV